MDEKDIFGEDGFIVNYSEVIKSKETLAVTKLLASQLMENPYMKVGQWFKNLSDSDISMLVEISDNNESKNFEDLILLVEMLANAEGVHSSLDMNELHGRVQHFVVLLVGEQLHRKGLVKFYHNNISFGEDAGDKIVMEKL